MSPAKKKAASPLVLTVLQCGSAIRCTERQKQTLKGLGLGRIGRVRVLQDTPSIRGMLLKVSHIVEIVQNPQA